MTEETLDINAVKGQLCGLVSRLSVSSDGNLTDSQACLQASRYRLKRLNGRTVALVRIHGKDHCVFNLDNEAHTVTVVTRFLNKYKDETA